MSLLKLNLNSTGLIKELTININKRLKMLEPITFPIAISLFFLNAAIELNTSSGADVTNETIVRPITKSETLCFFS